MSEADTTTVDVLDPTGSQRQRLDAMARRQSQCPVGTLGPAKEAGTLAVWYLASHTAVDAALPSVHELTGAVGAGTTDPEQQSFNGLPEPRHGQVRRIINGLVAAHRAKAAEPFIRHSCEHLLDELAIAPDAPDGVDLMAGFVDHLPCAVVAWLLGWPIDEPVQLYRWTLELCERAIEMGPGSTATVADLCPAFAAYVDERIGERLAQDEGSWPDDGLTHMLRAEIDGERLSPTFIRTQLVFLMGAASETSRDLIGGLLCELARDAELFERVRADRSLVPNAIEEALRLWTPVQFMMRRCEAPLTLDGVDIEPEDRVVIGLASANRDPARFVDPDRFDPARPNARSHVAFGGGPHVCPGAALARLEAQIAVNAFLDRFEAVSLAADEVPDLGMVMFHGPKELRVRLTPASD